MKEEEEAGGGRGFGGKGDGRRGELLVGWLRERLLLCGLA